MADDTDDIFKPKLGRIRSLGGARTKSYLNRVLRQVSKAGKSGFGTGAASRGLYPVRSRAHGGRTQRQRPDGDVDLAADAAVQHPAADDF